ncbi:MAG: tetratricopeptide repeat protein [Cyanobacteria bacterium RM1_2_2]|nr:tetratricopeptide repeat protein [Cyanobacteria bacterium RM1_2_2]
MTNPFRNLLPGIHPSVSASIYSASTPTGRASKPNKGFFHRLIHLGRVLQFSTEASYQTIEIDGEPAQHQENLSINSTVLHHATEHVTDNTASDIRHLDASYRADSTQDSAQNTANCDLVCLQTAHFHLQQGDLDAAIIHYRQAIELAPSRVEAYECLAEALTQQGDLEAAAACYRQAIALSQVASLEQVSLDQASAHFSPDSSKNSSAVAEPIRQASLKKKRRKAAEPETKTKKTSWFEQATFHLQQASVICNAGDWQEAQAACQNAIHLLEPEAANAYLILGRSLQGQKQFAAAEQAYHKSLVLIPSAEVYARLGSLYADQQRFTDAASCYQAAIQRDANFAGAYWKLAEVWQQLDQEVQSVDCWQRAFQLQPNWANASAYRLLGDRLLRLEQLEAAHHCYENALQRNPNLCEAQVGIGAVLTQQGQPSAAIEQYRLAIKLAIEQNPQNSQIYATVGAAFADLEQWEDAYLCYQRLADLAPERLDAIQGLYDCLTHLSRWQEALVYSRKLVEQQPDSAQDWQNLGDVLSRLSHWTEAVTAYEQAVRLDPAFSWAHNNLGDAFLHLEQWQRAASAFQTAISLNPDFAWTHYNLGRAWVRLQEWDQAIAAFQSALKVQPDLPYALGDLADALQQRSALDQANALAYYRQAIQQNPLDPEHYHKAIELQPDAVDLYLGLVDALLVHQQLDDAFVCCQLARQLQPENEEIIARLREILQQQELAKRPQTAADASVDYQRWIEQNTPTSAQLQQCERRH